MNNPSEAQINVGYFPEFKGLGKVLLFNGNREGLERLAEQLAHMKNTGKPASTDWMAVSKPMRLSLELAESASETGIFLSDVDNSVRWVFTNEDAIKFISLIKAVADSEIPCHQYLDVDEVGAGTDVSVMISKGEYVMPARQSQRTSGQ